MAQPADSLYHQARMSRFLFSLLVLTTAAWCESYPASWKYLNPDTNALIGVEWSRVRLSPFAQVVAGEFSSDGTFGFPDLDFLRDASQVVIASPGNLALANGQFALPQLRTKALTLGLKPARYRGVELLITSKRDALGVVLLSEQTILFGDRASLTAALDRGLSDRPRSYSELMAHAAQLGHSRDFWVIANALPDPMLSGFLPIDELGSGLTAIIGGVSFRDGLHMDLALHAGSEADASAATENLRKLVPELPEIMRGMMYTLDDTDLRLALDVSGRELAKNLRDPQEKPKAAPAAPVEAVGTPAVIRIYGLDDGVKEIPYRVK